MTGWIIFAVLFTWFLFIKVGIRFYWDSRETWLKIRIGILRFLLPTSDGAKKTDSKKKIKRSQTEMISEDPAHIKKSSTNSSLKSWIKVVLACWQDLLALVGKVLRSPTLDLLRLEIAAGGGDAEVCAMSYGKICAGLSAGLPLLHQLFRIKKQDIDVSCHFDYPKTEILAEVETTIMIHEVFALIGAALGFLVKIYFMKKRIDKAVQIV